MRFINILAAVIFCLSTLPALDVDIIDDHFVVVHDGLPNTESTDNRPSYDDDYMVFHHDYDPPNAYTAIEINYNDPSGLRHLKVLKLNDSGSTNVSFETIDAYTYEWTGTHWNGIDYPGSSCPINSWQENVLDNYVARIQEWAKYVEIDSTGSVVGSSIFDASDGDEIVFSFLTHGDASTSIPFSLPHIEMGCGKYYGRYIHLPNGVTLNLSDWDIHDPYFEFYIETARDRISMQFDLDTHSVNGLTLINTSTIEALGGSIYLYDSGGTARFIWGDGDSGTEAKLEALYGDFFEHMFEQYNEFLVQHNTSHTNSNFDDFLHGKCSSKIDTPSVVQDDDCNNGPDYAGGSNLLVSILYTLLKSSINNHTLDYVHIASDFVLPAGAPGCSVCGAADSPASGLPALDLQRIHRPLAADQRASFGPGVFMSYDSSLSIYIKEDDTAVIEFFDPYATQPYYFDQTTDGSSNMQFVEDNDTFNDLRLYDASTMTTSDLLAGTDPVSDATHARLKTNDGTWYEFEIVNVNDGTSNNELEIIFGRLIRISPRRFRGAGNSASDAITLSYVYAYNASAGTLSGTGDTNGYKRQKLWQIDEITDAYGRIASVTYEESLTGIYYISDIDIQGNSSTSVDYSLDYDYDGVTLTTVDYPESESSTFSKSLSSDGAYIVYAIDDAGVDGTHRRKDVYLQAAIAQNGSIQEHGLIRKMIWPGDPNDDDDDELTYQAWDSTYIDSGTVYPARLVYEGHRRLFRYVTTTSGAPKLAQFADTLSVDSNGQIVLDELGRPDVDEADWETFEEYEVDANNRVKKVTDGAGNIITATPFYDHGAAKDTVDGKGNTTTTEFNDYRQITHITDRLSRETRFDYDSTTGLLEAERLGNQLSPVDATAAHWNKTSYEYTSKGLLEYIKDAEYDAGSSTLHRSRFYYDADGYLTKKEDAKDTSGQSDHPEWEYIYDIGETGVAQELGLLHQTEDPLDRTVTYAYDGRMRVTTITYNDSSTEVFTYGTGDDENLLVKYEDRNSNVREHFYDDFGRRTETRLWLDGTGTTYEILATYSYFAGTTLVKSQTMDGETTDFTYDHHHNLKTRTVYVDNNTANKLVTTYHYDAADRLLMQEDPYGRRTYYTYDANNNVLRTIQEAIPGVIEDNFSAEIPTKTQLESLAVITRSSGSYTFNSVAYDNPPYNLRLLAYTDEEEVATMTDARGIDKTLTYDVLGRLEVITEADGETEEREVKYHYDENDNITRVDSARRRAWDNGDGSYKSAHPEDEYAFVAMTYNGRNMLASREYADGYVAGLDTYDNVEETESFTYYLDGRRDTKTDFNGNDWETIWHACCARFQAIIDPEGHLRLANNDYAGNVTHSAIVDSIADVTSTYSYSNPNNASHEITVEYDKRHRPLKRTQWLIQLPSVNANNPPMVGDGTYDSDDGLLTTWEYDDDITDGVGLDDSQGDWGSYFSGLGLGLLADGRAILETNAAGEELLRIYDGGGRRIKTVDSSGHVNTWSYSLTLTADELREVTQTDPESIVTKAHVDGLGRIWATVDGDGFERSSVYDNNGNLIERRNEEGTGVDQDFDKLDRLITVTDTYSDVREFTYDANNNLLISEDAKNETTTHIYDPRDRRVKTTDRLDNDATFAYDANSNLTKVTDQESSITQYEYDMRNIKERVIYPEGADKIQVVKFDLDEVGRVENRYREKHDPLDTIVTSERIEYQYDTLSRLEHRIYHDEAGDPQDDFTYDEVGRILTAVSGRYSNTVTRTYDAEGRMDSEKLTIDSTNYEVEFTYDDADRIATVEYPDGTTIRHSWHDRHLLDELEYKFNGESDAAYRRVVDIVYDDAGRVSTKAYGNSITAGWSYRDETGSPGDEDNMIASILAPDTGSQGENSDVAQGDLLDFAYGYDANKNKTVETDSRDSSYTQNFNTYDKLDRLTDWDRNTTSQTQTWSLSDTGDWDSTVIDSSTETRNHSDAHEFTSISGGATLSYDFKGNLTENINGDDYTWNDANQMESASDGTDTWDYEYDALGRRVKKDDGTNATIYVCAGSRVVAEYDDGVAVSNPDRRFVYGAYVDDVCMMLDTSDNPYFYHAGPTYSVEAISDTDGYLYETYEYGPYGELTIRNSSGTDITSTGSQIDNPYYFTGRRFDTETGLYYFRARYFDPYQGRFISRDPLGYVDGYGLYNGYFVPNGVDPSGLIDPDKLSPQMIIGYTPVWVDGGNEITVDSKSWEVTAPNSVDVDGWTSWDDLHVVADIQNHIAGNHGPYAVKPTPEKSAAATWTIATVFIEPLDWIDTGNAIYDSPGEWSNYIGLLPIVPGASRKVLKKNNCVDAPSGPTGMTDRAARREAMRQKGIPTSQQPTSQSGRGSQRQYEYETTGPGGGRQTQAVTHHPADKQHPKPHWHAGDARVDPATGQPIRNRHGQVKYHKEGSATVQHD